MTPTYDDYRLALARLRDLPGRTAADLGAAQERRQRAGVLAEQAEAEAQAVAARAIKAVETQLAAARAAIEPLGMVNLIPPRMRPSGGPKSATRDDIANSERALIAAVGQLREAVQAEFARIEAENERLAREAAERETLAREAAEQAAAAAARRKRLIQLGVLVVVLAAVLILVLIFTL